MSKTWREQLKEIGGYENGFTAVQAFAMREIIDELEYIQSENTRLKQRLVHLEQAATRPTLKELMDAPVTRHEAERKHA